MNKNKKIFTFVTSILAIILLFLSFSKTLYYIKNSTFEYFNIINIYTEFFIYFLLIIHLFLIIKLIFAYRNTNKYFDLSKFQRNLIFANITVIIIGIIDFLYNILFIRKLSSSIKYFASFTFSYLIIIELVYLALQIWLILLRKEKIKYRIKEKLKFLSAFLLIFNNILIILNERVQYTTIILIIMLVILFIDVFITKKKLLLYKWFSLIILVTNILYIIIFLLSDNDTIYIILFLISNLLNLILILKYANYTKNKILRIIFQVIACLLFIFIAFISISKIVHKVEKIVKENQNYEKVLIGKEYSKHIDYDYLKIKKDNTVSNVDEIKNIIYTSFDSGYNKVAFKCSDSYYYCNEDVVNIFGDSELVTIISTYVSPYYGFKKLEVIPQVNMQIDSQKKVYKVYIDRYYDDHQIEFIKKEIENIYQTNYDKNKSVKDNIKIFHDYIINNTKSIDDINNNDAYNLLKNKKSSSQGYADVMGLILDRMNIQNIRIVSEKHIWNLVNIDNKWYHLDVLWDDPIVDDGSDRLFYDYFLIDDEKLKSLNTGFHNYTDNYNEFFK